MSPFQVIHVFQARFNCDGWNLLRTQNLAEQDPIRPSILFEAPSHAIYEKADAVEGPDKRVELVDCLPMGNTALLCLVEPRGVVYIETYIANGGFMALVLEGASDRTVGHFGDVLACHHVYDGTFPASR